MRSHPFSMIAIVLTGLIALTACETAENSEAGDKAEATAAAAEPAKKSRLDDFTVTEETENCLSLARIDRTDVLDDQTIIFEMKGNEYYVNRLPYRCPQLGFEERYTYSTSLTQLCNTDIITVLTTTGRGASCGLGMFERLEKKEPTENDESSE